ncbi:MAG: MFS transporter, partial [Hylemonella sp.]
MFSINIALPKIAAEFKDVPLEDLSWILNGYAIAYAALLVFFGRLAEGYRRDRSFILGVGMFTLAAAASATATNVWMLVGYRVIAAAGAALMTPTSIGLILATFPPERRGAAVRNWAGIGGLAAALGPVLGGALVSIDWRWVFVANAALGATSILIGWRHLPHVLGHEVKRPSLIAAFLVTAGIASLIFAIVKINAWGWRSPQVMTSLAISLFLLCAFLFHSLRSSNPLVDPALFRIRPYSGAALAMIPYSVSFGAMLFSVAVWGQSAWGWSALQAGLAIIPGPLM